MKRSDLPVALRDRALEELPPRWRDLLVDESEAPVPQPPTEPQPEPTAEELTTQAIALAEQRNRDAERTATRDAVRTILGDINAEIDRARAVKSTPNATIKANPAPYINDLATSMIRLAQATKDLARFVRDM